MMPSALNNVCKIRQKYPLRNAQKYAVLMRLCEK